MRAAVCRKPFGVAGQEVCHQPLDHALVADAVGRAAARAADAELPLVPRSYPARS